MTSPGTFSESLPRRGLRLGDDVDDHCVKCKRITNHVIVAFLDDEPAKVRCRSCYHEHEFLNMEEPPKKPRSS